MTPDAWMQVYWGGVIAIALTTIGNALMQKDPAQSRKKAQAAALAGAWPLIAAVSIIGGVGRMLFGPKKDDILGPDDDDDDDDPDDGEPIKVKS